MIQNRIVGIITIYLNIKEINVLIKNIVQQSTGYINQMGKGLNTNGNCFTADFI